MGYEKIDENETYKDACEKVKKIVNAIKALKIKYYLNLAGMSEKDKEILDELQQQLEEIPEENGLQYLKKTLMSEIISKYEPESKDVNQGTQSPDELVKACYGAIDAETTALSCGRIKQARRCQTESQKYLEMMKSQKYLDPIKLQKYEALITEYRRRKFGELAIGRDNGENKTAEWLSKLKEFYRPDDLQERGAIRAAIKENMNKGQGRPQSEQDKEMIH